MTSPPNHQLAQRLAIVTGAVSTVSLPIADACIVYRDESFALEIGYAHSIGGSPAVWDVDGDGGAEFGLSTYSSGGKYAIYLSSAGLNGRGLVGTGSDFYDLRAGRLVGPTPSPYAWGDASTTRTLLSTSSAGAYFVGGDLGSNFIGFRFDRDGGLHYGWAEVILAADRVSIARWAYNDQPDGSIRVGQTDLPPPLVLLAAGAFGLGHLRRRRGG